MNLGNLDKKTKDKIYQTLYEYKVLTQAAQQLKTIEDWYYDLIDDTEETMNLMKEIIAERKSNARTKS